MGPASRTHGETAPLEFFPGEVARLLQLGDTTYEQLRALFVLSRAARGERIGREWARFDAEDLAATEVLVGLVGGRERFQPNRRLILRDIRPACDALREMGFANPLLDVPLARQGRRVLALVGQHVYVPSTRQLVLAFVREQITELDSERQSLDREARAVLSQIREQRTARAKGSRGRMAALEAHVESIARAM